MPWVILIFLPLLKVIDLLGLKNFVDLEFKVSEANTKAKQLILFLPTLHYSQFSCVNKDLDKYSFLKEWKLQAG